VKRVILGTAGHIDHGKTALVRALTGVDTDRLKEEKERGITIDLGFAELADEEVRLGIVDVPGHEGFIRNMLAGATGMDVVLLVIAADEGVMPQTREHLAIVRLLGVRSLVVAITKADLVEEAWLELVVDEATELLQGTPLEGAPVVVTSARSGRGLDELGAALRDAAAGADEDDPRDVTRLPVDRVFTVKGTGTVVTGTLWSGSLAPGATMYVRPGEGSARVRGLQVHGRDVERGLAGERTAVALAGSGIDRESVNRGDVLVELEAWPESHMLTVRAELLGDTGWSLEHNQRVRVHVGTAEVMARTVLLDPGDTVPPGGRAWIQLRLEAPVVARARERLVLRSYSPVTTIGGGVIAEPAAPKRKRLGPDDEERLLRVLEGDGTKAVEALLALADWQGVSFPALPVLTGLPPDVVASGIAALGDGGALRVGDALLGTASIRRGLEALEAAVVEFHRRHPLRPGALLEALRDALPTLAPDGTADALLDRLVAEGKLELRGEVAAAPGFRTQPTAEQEAVRARLTDIYVEAGLAPPAVGELPPELAERDDLWPLLKLMESEGALTALADGVFVDTRALEAAAAAVRESLGGRTGLGPTDFKEILPVSRKHLIPILGWMDRSGVSVRRRDGREVPTV
jgi:selenocysteine-specific elongation factor